MRIALILLGACLLSWASAGTASAAEQPKNLLFFGNSFTIGNGGWDVPRIVKEIAVAAGHPAPTVEMQAYGGWTLGQHIDKIDTDSPGGVIHSLPSGQTWDALVMQDYSTRPTAVSSIGGDLAAHRADAVTLSTRVRDHSPVATPVLFQTWARSPEHSYYPGTFASASAMQQQVSTGYSLSAGDIDLQFGAGTARIAPVGDAFEAYGWSGLYQENEWYHASNHGSLLAAMVLYSTIYNASLEDVNLSGVLVDLGLPTGDAASLKAAAAAVTPEPTALAALGIGVPLLLARRRR